ncbi:hypothetical protein G6F56_006813 [Rhizopus delemar]|nr:hypothetical protein G6F56_006813 [Rhizopus delemar]
MDRKRPRNPNASQRLANIKKIKTQKVIKKGPQKKIEKKIEKKPEETIESVQIQDAIQSKIPADKLAELEAVRILNKSSKELAQQFENLAERTESLVDEIGTTSKTMQNWTHVFDIMKNPDIRTKKTIKFNCGSKPV